MRVPIVTTRAHLGKSLELDCDRETITVFGPSGEELGTLTWASVIDQLLTRSMDAPLLEGRTDARVTLSFQVQYRTPEGNRFEGQARGIGGGGLFIESSAPLPVGTKLAIDFALPDAPADHVEARGVVAWVCPRSDQYTNSAGMGIQFTEISPETRACVSNLVRSHHRSA